MNKKTKKNLANVLIIALLICGIAWIASVYWHVGGTYTDNAQIAQDIVNVNARVPGFVKHIYVEEYQFVHKGDTLLTIEDSEFRLHVAQARAGLENALAGKAAGEKGVRSVDNQIDVTTAGIDELNVLLGNAKTEYLRYEALYAQNAVTRQQLDGVRTQYEQLQAKIETLRRQRTGGSIERDLQSLRVAQQDAAIEVAKATLNLAEINLSYCTLTAPCDGYTSRKQVQTGELVQPGMNLLCIVDRQQRWVVANFRETQREGLVVGHPVEITVDAYKGTTFEGRIAGISTATGTQYSPAAPDNAIGNYVKVEQRIPVKIVFTKNNDANLLEQLSAGMNVECKVLSNE